MPSSFFRNQRLVDKFIKNNGIHLANTFRRHCLLRSALNKFSEHVFSASLLSMELARLLKNQIALRRKHRVIANEVFWQKEDGVDIGVPEWRNKARLMLWGWRELVKDLKEKDMSDVPWNNYMRRKKKLMPTDEQTQMVESRISLSEDPFVNTSFANMDYSMSIHHPEQVRKALVSIGLEPWQHHAMAQKKRSSKEEMVLTRSGFLSNSFVESRTGLGGDSYWHYD